MKRKNGRPPKSEGKRIKKIDARFTEEEYAAVLALEKELGVRKTELVRTRLLQNAPSVLVNAKEMIRYLDAIGGELGRSGNNINQLARYANTLQIKEVLSPVVTERFNILFEQHIQQQIKLETVLRRIIRLLGR